VTVRIDRDTRRAKADRSGAWSTALPARRAGGPLRVVVATVGDSLVFSNVLIGDVWVASGQSNREFPVSQSANADATIAAANDSTIREFKVPTSWANEPARDLAGGSWLPADPKHVGSFSAVAYFYARHLRPSVGVPLGIINTTWGGSNIETWISRGAQHLDDSAWSAISRARRIGIEQFEIPSAPHWAMRCRKSIRGSSRELPGGPTPRSMTGPGKRSTSRRIGSHKATPVSTASRGIASTLRSNRRSCDPTSC
jgi:sialate O-acetylesterase